MSLKKGAAVRSLLYSGDLVAVDFGTCAVKIMTLKAKEHSLIVHACARREVWKELAAAASEDEKRDVYARALRALLVERGVKLRNASISLAGNIVVMRFAPLSQDFDVDPKTGLPIEARGLIPFDEPDTVTSVVITQAPAKKGKGRPELILAAAKRESVQAGMDAARKAGVRPAVIVNDAVAMGNAVEFFRSRKGEETIALVVAGASSTSVCVAENGVLKTARVLNIAGAAFTRAVKREFDVELEEAERLKILHGFTSLAGGEEADGVRVARALKPAAKDLAGEILRTLDVYAARRSSEHPGVKSLLLAGGSAKLKGLADLLSDETGLEVEVFKPVVNVGGAGGEAGIQALDPEFAVACGLALSNSVLRRSAAGRINLVPHKARRSAILLDVSPGFGRRFLAPAAIAAALSLYAVWAVNVTRHESAQEQALEAAAAREAALERKFTKKKQAAAAPKPVVDPYAYLGRLTVSGVMGDAGNLLVMLGGSGGVYVARGGRLYDANEEEVRGVTTEIRDNALRLFAGGKRYTIELPK